MNSTARTQEVLTPTTPEGLVSADIAKARLGALTLEASGLSRPLSVALRFMVKVSRFESPVPRERNDAESEVPAVHASNVATDSIPETESAQEAKPEDSQKFTTSFAIDKLKDGFMFQRRGGRSRWVKCSKCHIPVRERLAQRIKGDEKEGSFAKSYCCQQCSSGAQQLK